MLRTFLATTVAAALLIASPSSAALFGRFEGILGDSVDPQHEDWLDLSSLSVSYDIVDPTNPQSLVWIRLRFGMEIDSAYPDLVELSLRRLPADAEFEQFETIAGTSRVVVRYEATNAGLGDISASHGGSAGALTGFIESMSRFKITTYRYLPNGTLNGSRVFSYTFTPTGFALAVPPAGDYNFDGVVDTADYQVWKETFGALPASLGAGADGNADGQIDAADYTVWRDALTQNQLPATNTVPEASGLSLGAAATSIAVLVVCCRRYNRGVPG